MIIALGLLISSILSYFDVYVNVFMGYTCGVSLLTVGHMYNSSIVHKFCAYHRMFIYYIVVNNAVNILDYYFQFTTTAREMLTIHCIVAGVFLFLILYFYTKRKRRDYGINDSYKEIALPSYR